MSITHIRRFVLATERLIAAMEAEAASRFPDATGRKQRPAAEETLRKARVDYHFAKQALVEESQRETPFGDL